MGKKRQLVAPRPAAVALLVLLTFGVKYGFSMWHHSPDGNFAVAAGYHPRPPETSMDDLFRNQNHPDGRRQVAFATTVCCLNPNACTNPTEIGVWFWLDITVSGGAGAGAWSSASSASKSCCTPCCLLDGTVTENAAAPWGGPAWNVDLTVTAYCICCVNGMEISTDIDLDDYEYPVPLGPLE